MKKIFSLLFLSLLLIFGVANIGVANIGAAKADAASIWTKYVATDNSFSFYYPSGWKVISNDSIVGVENSKTDEQLIMAMIPVDQQMSTQDLASGFLDILKDSNPNISASNWRSLTETADDQVIFDLADKNNDKEYSGLGIVIKSDQQALWFSYFSPASDYYQIRGYKILQGFIGSLAYGLASKAPNIDYNINIASKIDSNAKAFMFVLEFSLGAPFTKSQEDAILDELKDGWRYLSEEELEIYDQYPILVKTILKMDQKDLEELRTDLEKTIRTWLDETDQSDQAVKIISSNLKSRGKVVIKGKPPLTEMSLTAYSEIIAYSRLLQKNPKAKPDQISQKSVVAIKKQVKKVWKSFSSDDRKDIATTPGLWVCLRVQFKYGSKKQQDKIRENLKKLEAVTRNMDSNNSTNPETNSGTNSGTNEPMDMTTHWCMMQMQQQTFNTYMWSQGFNYLPATGKMW